MMAPDMRIRFTKMNGAGNDFVLIDNRNLSLDLGNEQVRRLCDRQRGIGADGLMLLEPGNGGEADWSWQFFNRDGRRAEMCGNGARCFASFVRNLTGDSSPMAIRTGAGIVRAGFEGDLISITLTPPGPVEERGTMEIAGRALTVHSVDTGVPHAVVFVEGVDRFDTVSFGSAIRNHPDFAPEGTNVNFAELSPSGPIQVRTYERGVEAETLACGTGISATALVASHVHGMEPPLSLEVRGGEALSVDFRKTDSGYRDVRLTGPAETVFTGVIVL